MKEKVYIDNKYAVIEKETKETTAYIREDIYMSLAKTLENEQDKNNNLRKEIEGLKHDVELYKALLRTKQEAPHYHDEQTIISKQ